MWEVADAPIFEMGMGTIFCIEKQKEVFGYVSKNMLLSAKKDVLEAWHTEDELKQAGIYGNKFYLNPKRFKNHIESISHLIDEFSKNKNEYKKQVERSCTKGQIVKLIKSFALKQTEVFAYYNSTNTQFFSLMEENLRKTLVENGVKNVDDAVNKLTTTSLVSTLQKENLEFLQILSNHWNQLTDQSTPSKELIKKLGEHSKKYSYLSGNEGAKPWNTDYYLEQTLRFCKSKKTPQQEITKLESNISKQVGEKQEFIVKHSLSEEVAYLGEVLGMVGYYRLELRILWSQYFKLLREMIYKYASELHVSPYELMSMGAEEMTAGMSSKRIKEKDVQEKYEAYLFQIKNHRLTKAVYGKSALAAQRRLVPSEDFSHIKVIEGKTAYPGVVEGVAYVIRWNDDLEEKMADMPDGAVLVVGNARPSLLPAIKRAGAVVTDEGGVMSHAAIVTRELHKPCIVGTKSATKTYKTGDHLRVDTTKGNVTKIDKKGRTGSLKNQSFLNKKS